MSTAGGAMAGRRRPGRRGNNWYECQCGAFRRMSYWGPDNPFNHCGKPVCHVGVGQTIREARRLGPSTEYVTPRRPVGRDPAEWTVPRA